MSMAQGCAIMDGMENYLTTRQLTHRANVTRRTIVRWIVGRPDFPRPIRAAEKANGSGHVWDWQKVKPWLVANHRWDITTDEPISLRGAPSQFHRRHNASQDLAQ